ncbi:MAG: S9 family peptidase [Bacteroidia bacterium]|nr:S9 family peptidase [Bacteroidia bacterium]
MTSNNAPKLPGDISLPSSEEELSRLIAHESGKFRYEIEDFFRKPEKTGYQLSPDGTYYSYVAPYERRLNIFVQPVGSSKSHRITHETERDISGYIWASSDRLIYIKDSGGDENFRIFAVDKDGGNLLDLVPVDGIRIEIIDPLRDNEQEIIIGMNKNNPQLFEPYRLNIIDGSLKQLATNENPEEPISSWKTDHEGKLKLATQLVEGTLERILYRPTESDPWKTVITTDFRDTLSPMFFDFDNGSIVYALSNLNRDKTVIIKYDLNKAEEIGEPLYVHKDVDISGLAYSRKRKVITHASYTTDRGHKHFFDEKREEIQDFLDKKLGGYETIIANSNKEETKHMIRTYSDRSLGAYYVLDSEDMTLEHITDVSPWIHEEDLSPMQPISYIARDGLKINGYLTLPLNQDSNLPLVVNPHGGPWVRDVWTYNPEVQLLANRGYAVLQMNYRGSTGYGRAFWEKGFKEWGKKMQDDITDGVQYLIERGNVDKKRVAIYGGSYGGYATLAGVTFTPKLYKCAIDYVGVSNLFTFMKTIPPYWKPYLQTMYEMVGNPETDTEQMASASPALHVDKIEAPLYVVQGANDPRVNIDEADQIVRQLRDRNIDVPYMVKYNEGHGFRNEENQFEFYKTMIGFLAKHLKK